LSSPVVGASVTHQEMR